MYRNLVILGACTLLIVVVLLGSQITLLNDWVEPRELIYSERQECLSVQDCAVFRLSCDCGCATYGVSVINLDRYHEALEPYCNVVEGKRGGKFCPLLDCGEEEVACVNHKCQMQRVEPNHRVQRPPPVERQPSWPVGDY